MPPINFYLRPGKEKKQIHLFVTLNRKRLHFSIGESIEQNLWNPKAQRARLSKLFNRELTDLNARLDEIESDLKDLFRKEKVLSEPILKRLINDYLNPEQPKQESLLLFIEEFIKGCEAVRKPNTLKAYRTTFRYLQNFISETGYRLDFHNVSAEFYDKLLSWLFKKGLVNNSVGKHIKVLKTFLREAEERGVQVNADYKKRKFKTLKEEADNIYLNEEELARIYRLELIGSIERVRDLFIIGAFTGLRFSDFSRISSENIKAGAIHIRTQKTDEAVSIPIHHFIKEIIVKYGGTFPKALSNQKMNEYLKEIGRLAGIDEPIIIRHKKQASVYYTTHKKFELIKTHTARRSAATNMVLAGVSRSLVMELMGLRTEAILMNYIKVSGEENARLLSAHPFFSGKLKIAS